MHLTINLFGNNSNLFACNGILFNHENPRRGETFVTWKITRAVAQIMAGQQRKLYLGNLEAKRDWGYAPEYVELMWLLLQQETPDDYVIGTRESYFVREFVQEAFSYVGLDWQAYVAVDPKYFRPLEVTWLAADASRARQRLGWGSKVTFRDLVRIMVDADMELVGLDSIGEAEQILAERFPEWHRWTSSVTSVVQNNKHGFE